MDLGHRPDRGIIMRDVLITTHLLKQPRDAVVAQAETDQRLEQQAQARLRAKPAEPGRFVTLAGPRSSGRGVNRTPGGGAMSTTLHETPPRQSSPRPPRRRPVALFVAGAVLVVAIGAGAALALGGRSADPSDQPAAAAQPVSGQRQQGSGQEQSSNPSGSPTRE